MCKLVWHLLKTLVYFFRKLPHLWQLLWIDPFTTWAEAISHCLHKYNDQTHVWSWPENYIQHFENSERNFLYVTKLEYVHSFLQCFSFIRLHPLFHCKWLDVMHLMYWLLAADQNWYFAETQTESVDIAQFHHWQKIKKGKQFIKLDKIALNHFRISLELIK